MERLYFNSSLPRAGSTLLQNLVGQNPAFHVTPTSGFLDLILGARIGYNENVEARAGDPEQWKNGFINFCREGTYGYWKTITNKPYVLDKNRAFGTYYDLMHLITPNPRMVCMVRDLRSIFASMEKKFRANPDIETKGVRNNELLIGTTTHKRVEGWAAGLPIGLSLDRLQDVLLMGHDKHVLFIRYEDLCTNPDAQMRILYEHFELPYFQHTYAHIPQITVEDDSVHGIYGDHTIRNTLQMLPEDYNEILGYGTSNAIYERYNWFYQYFGYKK
jgi:sulfotransferase